VLRTATATNATYAQSLVLKLLARAPFKLRSIPLVIPKCTIATGGIGVAHLYDELFCHNVYESPKPLPANPRIVDAGGHLGLASIYFLSRYPDCDLTAVEPNPWLASLLRANLSPWSARAHVLEGALSVRSGSADFHFTTDNRLNVTGGLENREPPERQVSRVRVAALDAAEVLAEPVDLLKLDVEGHEFQLLWLSIFQPAHIRNLVVEFHDVAERRAAFTELMSELRDVRGYRASSVDGVELPVKLPADLPSCVVLKLY
jgi:FkbM family methyltransferase